MTTRSMTRRINISLDEATFQRVERWRDEHRDQDGDRPPFSLAVRLMLAGSDYQQAEPDPDGGQ